MIRSVIETNVLVSGLLSLSGNEALILPSAPKGPAHPCFSEEILEGCAAVLARPKFAFPPEKIAVVLASGSIGIPFSPDRGQQLWQPTRGRQACPGAGRG